MAEPLTLACARTCPFPIETAFDFTLTTPLPELFPRWYGPLPPVSSVDGPEPWGTPGQTRTVHTADGGSVREELLTVDRPVEFTYQLSQITGPLRHLVSAVDGGWRFDPVGTGTRVEWRWGIHPTSRLGQFALPMLGKLWRGYARRSLDRLDGLLVTRLA